MRTTVQDIVEGETPFLFAYAEQVLEDERWPDKASAAGGSTYKYTTESGSHKNLDDAPVADVGDDYAWR